MVPLHSHLNTFLILLNRKSAQTTSKYYQTLQDVIITKEVQKVQELAPKTF